MHTYFPRIIPFALIAVLGGSASADVAAEPFARVQDLTKVGQVALSEDCRHVAYVLIEAGSKTLFLDGQKRITALDIQALSLSYDGQHMGCWTFDGTDWAVRLDDKTLATYSNRIGQNTQKPTPITFSADGKHWAYAAMDNTGWLSSIDGATRYAPRPVEHIQLSADGAHYEYVVDLDGQSKGVVVDGRRSDALLSADRWAFTPDAQHYACRIRVLPDRRGTVPWDTTLHRRYAIVVDGQASPDSFSTAGPLFVQGQPLYGYEHQFILNNKPLDISPDAVSGWAAAIGVSPDGKHVAALTDGYLSSGSRAAMPYISTLFLDGRRIKQPFSSPHSEMHVVVSPDGTDYAVAVSDEGDAKTVFWNNKEFDTYTLDLPVFSPDSKHFASEDADPTGTYIQIDGKDIDDYQLVRQDPTVDAIGVGSCPYKFDADGSFHFVGFDSDGKLYRITWKP